MCMINIIAILICSLSIRLVYVSFANFYPNRMLVLIVAVLILFIVFMERGIYQDGMKLQTHLLWDIAAFERGELIECREDYHVHSFIREKISEIQTENIVSVQLFPASKAYTCSHILKIYYNLNNTLMEKHIEIYSFDGILINVAK